MKTFLTIGWDFILPKKPETVGRKLLHNLWVFLTNRSHPSKSLSSIFFCYSLTAPVIFPSASSSFLICSSHFLNAKGFLSFSHKNTYHNVYTNWTAHATLKMISEMMLLNVKVDVCSSGSWSTRTKIANSTQITHEIQRAVLRMWPEYSAVIENLSS